MVNTWWLNSNGGDWTSDDNLIFGYKREWEISDYAQLVQRQTWQQVSDDSIGLTAPHELLRISINKHFL